MRVSVIVPARNAAATLGRTLEALASQDLDGEYEVIVVDDGSADGTVDVVKRAGGPVRLLSDGRCGAAEARNRGVAAAQAAVLAFTDADCFPAPSWLSAGLAALEHADLVQGRVAPDPESDLGPFDRTIWVEAERGLYETANLFIRRELFERVGGFEDWLDTRGGKLMAEDLWLGWRAVRAGARTAFAPDALVHHAVFRRGPAGFIGERTRLRHFPAIVRKVPELRRRSLFGGLFLTRRSAAFDLALAGAVRAAARGSPIPLVAAAPYARMVVRGTRVYRKRAPLVVVVRVVADAVSLSALLIGSARSRSPVL